MSTIASGRRFNVTDAASFVALSQQNRVIASDELFRCVPPTRTAVRTRSTDHQHPERGASATSGGPEPGGVRLHYCRHTWDLAADRRGTRHHRSSQRSVPAGYLILNLTDRGGLKRHAGRCRGRFRLGPGLLESRLPRSCATAQRVNASRPRTPASPVSSPRQRAAGGVGVFNTHRSSPSLVAHECTPQASSRLRIEPGSQLGRPMVHGTEQLSPSHQNLLLSIDPDVTHHLPLSSDKSHSDTEPNMPNHPSENPCVIRTSGGAISKSSLSTQIRPASRL